MNLEVQQRRYTGPISGANGKDNRASRSFKFTTSRFSATILHRGHQHRYLNQHQAARFHKIVQLQLPSIICTRITDISTPCLVCSLSLFFFFFFLIPPRNPSDPSTRRDHRRSITHHQIFDIWPLASEGYMRPGSPQGFCGYSILILLRVVSSALSSRTNMPSLDPGIHWGV